MEAFKMFSFNPSNTTVNWRLGDFCPFSWLVNFNLIQTLHVFSKLIPLLCESLDGLVFCRRVWWAPSPAALMGMQGCGRVERPPPHLCVTTTSVFCTSSKWFMLLINAEEVHTQKHVSVCWTLSYFEILHLQMGTIPWAEFSVEGRHLCPM